MVAEMLSMTATIVENLATRRQVASFMRMRLPPPGTATRSSFSSQLATSSQLQRDSAIPGEWRESVGRGLCGERIGSDRGLVAEQSEHRFGARQCGDALEDFVRRRGEPGVE
jgi:hypothetical protein